MGKNKQPLTIEQQHEIYEYIQEKKKQDMEKKKQDREKKQRELISLINHWDDLAFCNLDREVFIKNRDKFIDMYIEEFGKDDYYDWFIELKELIGKK